MQNSIISISVIEEILGQIARIFWITVPIIGTVWWAIYVFTMRKQIEKKQDEIFKVKKEIDDMLLTVHNKTRGSINQSQLEAITERSKIPLRAKLETLQMERQFLLDKISILNLVKK